MGVTLIQPYPVPPDKTAPQVIELIQKRILNLGAVCTGQFLVDCETYFSGAAIPGHPQQVRTLHVLHNSEHPATVFSILDAPGQQPGQGQKITFTSDTLFDYLLLKLSNVYNKKLRIESKGSRFEIGDFVVKLGIVQASTSVKGILVEVEYLPCVVVQTCWSLIHEFAQGFLGSSVSSQIPAYLKAKTAPYTPSDTVHQYLEHFTNYRKIN